MNYLKVWLSSPVGLVVDVYIFCIFFITGTPTKSPAECKSTSGSGCTEFANAVLSNEPGLFMAEDLLPAVPSHNPTVLNDQQDTVGLPELTGTCEPSNDKSGQVFTLEKVEPAKKRKKKSVREVEEDRAAELFEMKKRVMQHEMDCRAAEFELKLKEHKLKLKEHELKLKEHELKMKLLLRQVSNTGNK